MEEDFLQSLETTQQFEDTTMRDTTFGEKLPTTTLTTRGLIPTTTSGTLSQQWDTTAVGHHNKWDNSGTTEEPVFQHIGYKLLRTTTPTEQTGDPDVSQHITYRDGSNHRHYRVTCQVVYYLWLTSKQKFCHSIDSLKLLSTGCQQKLVINLKGNPVGCAETQQRAQLEKCQCSNLVSMVFFRPGFSGARHQCPRLKPLTWYTD